MKFAPSTLIAILAIIVIVTWSSKSSLEHDVRDLTIRDIQLAVFDESQTPISNVTVAIDPRYSFDKIKPRNTFSTLDEGSMRLTVMFVRNFIIRVGANGYTTRTIEYSDDSPSELKVILKRLSAEQGGGAKR